MARHVFPAVTCQKCRKKLDIDTRKTSNYRGFQVFSVENDENLLLIEFSSQEVSFKLIQFLRLTQTAVPV